MTGAEKSRIWRARHREEILASRRKGTAPTAADALVETVEERRARLGAERPQCMVCGFHASNWTEREDPLCNACIPRFVKARAKRIEQDRP